MRDVFAADTVRNLMQPLIEKGFLFQYFYEKENEKDVYICRFKKGKDYFDWRESTDGKEISVSLFVKGESRALPLKEIYPKAHRRFWWKHLFRKVSANERRAFIAELLVGELTDEKPDFFGIKL